MPTVVIFLVVVAFAVFGLIMAMAARYLTFRVNRLALS